MITLAWNEALQGFPEEPLEKALFGMSALDVREYFYVHGGVPYLTLVVLLPDTHLKVRRSTSRQTEDPGKDLPEKQAALYRDLRRWRNERARAEGIPSYLIFRNAQLAEICRRAPKSLADLREIEGIGEGTCKKYGAEVLALLPEDLGMTAQTNPT